LFRLHEGSELVGRGRRGRGILAVELLFQLGGREYREAGPAQRVEDVRRRTRGRHQAVPIVGIDRGIAELGGRRNVPGRGAARGNGGPRAPDAPDSALIAPGLMCGSRNGTSATISWMCPPSMSLTAGPTPR